MAHPLQPVSGNVQPDPEDDQMVDVDVPKPNRIDILAARIDAQKTDEDLIVAGQADRPTIKSEESGSEVLSDGVVGEAHTFEGRPAVRSAEGWVLMVSGIHQEATEADVIDLFEDHGRVTTIRLNQSLATGYLMGYALVQFDRREEAADAIRDLNGVDFFDQKLGVDWAFIQPVGRDDEQALIDRVREVDVVNTQYSRHH